MNPAALLPGDVILETGNSAFGRAIRAVDGGAFSHALMWVGNTDFIEAVTDGARIISFARVLVTDPEHLLLLRHPDPAVARVAADEARNLAFKGYAFGKALATKLPVKPSSPTSLFCSQLIAEAYARAGSDLVTGKLPAKVKPRDLVDNSILQSLGTPALLEVKLEPGERPLLNRDKAYKGSLPARELRITKDAFAAVEPMTRALIPRPGNLAETLNILAGRSSEHKALADAVLNELEQRGYFSLLDDLIPKIASGAPITATPHVVASWRQSALRHRREWQTHQKLAARDPHALWRRLAQLYLRNQLLFAALAERAEEESGPTSGKHDSNFGQAD